MVAPTALPQTELSDENSFVGPGKAPGTIEDLFQFIPNELKPAPNHTTSDSTRPPGLYDMHMAKDLVLDKVVYCPSIEDDLLKIADDALRDAQSSHTLPPGKPLGDITSVASAIDDVAGNIVDESSLTQVYERTYAKFCRTIAATLEFRHSQWSHKFLLWHQTLRTGAQDQGVAIPDGFLSLGVLGRERLPDDLAQVADKFPALAVWEFKNFVAGDKATLDAILLTSQRKKFPWIFCEDKDCAIVHATDSGKPWTTGSRMGFDADVPICSSILVCGDQVPDISLKDAFRSKHQRKAVYIVQQGWAEGVHYDATFIIIHAGRYEIIAIRHRETGTLYISGIIELSKCNYIKLHVGLYIAALRDAKIRAGLLATRGEPSTWLRSFDDCPTDEALLKTMTREERSMYILSQACCRRHLVFHTPLRHSYIPFVPSGRYDRLSPSAPTEIAVKDDGVVPFIKIRLPRKAARTIFGSLVIDGHMFEGVAARTISRRILVKNAAGAEAAASLRTEFKNYVMLAKKHVPGIPRMIGLFKAHMTGEEEDLQFAAVLMEDVGESVASNPGAVIPFHREAFESILRDIHAAGLLHGDISADHLMLKRSAVSMIGFSKAVHAEEVDNFKAATKIEQDELQKVLDKPLGRRLQAPVHSKDLISYDYPYSSMWEYTKEDPRTSKRSKHE